MFSGFEHLSFGSGAEQLPDNEKSDPCSRRNEPSTPWSTSPLHDEDPACSWSTCSCCRRWRGRWRTWSTSWTSCRCRPPRGPAPPSRASGWCWGHSSGRCPWLKSVWWKKKIWSQVNCSQPQSLKSCQQLNTNYTISRNFKAGNFYFFTGN